MSWQLAVESKSQQRLTNERKLKMCISDLYLRYRDWLLQILTQFSSLWDRHLQRVSISSRKIELLLKPNPYLMTYYQAGVSVLDFQGVEVQKLLFRSVIELAWSKWVAPVVFAPMKDVTQRFRLDEKNLSNLNAHYSYPLLQIKEYVDSLGEATVFSTLKVNSGQGKGKVKKKTKQTTITSHYGLYRIDQMLFSLKSAPRSFLRTMDATLASIK